MRTEMKPFINGKFHAWQGNNAILLSDEEEKKLREFKTIDECINWLFINGYKEIARALNKHKSN